MSAVYHSGELAVQARAGVEVLASRAGRIIGATIPPIAAEFMSRQRLGVIGTTDGKGRVWASLLTGEQGFMRAIDERTVRIKQQPHGDDPLAENLKERCDAGMLVIDFSTRRRMRMNGRAMMSDDEIYLQTSQVYSNCPKYIHARDIQPEEQTQQVRYVSRQTALTTEQQRWINNCDTFFIASFHPEGGADASHRGGAQGFVRVANESTIMWPDYPGNNMFNSLGNLFAYPYAGLLFIDFEHGRTLQLTGQARAIWYADQNAERDGAQRIVTFHAQEVIEMGGACPLRWRLVESAEAISGR